MNLRSNFFTINRLTLSCVVTRDIVKSTSYFVYLNLFPLALQFVSEWNLLLNTFPNENYYWLTSLVVLLLLLLKSSVIYKMCHPRHLLSLFLVFHDSNTISTTKNVKNKSSSTQCRYSNSQSWVSSYNHLTKAPVRKDKFCKVKMAIGVVHSWCHSLIVI